MICDNRERKLFVGDSKGNLFTVNIQNGAVMMQFDKHVGASVTTLAYANPVECKLLTI